MAPLWPQILGNTLFHQWFSLCPSEEVSVMLFCQGLKGYLTREVKGRDSCREQRALGTSPWWWHHDWWRPLGAFDQHLLGPLLAPRSFWETHTCTHTHSQGHTPMPCFPLNAEETSFLCTFHALTDRRDLWCVPAQSLCAWLEETELMRELSEMILHVLWGGILKADQTGKKH